MEAKLEIIKGTLEAKGVKFIRLLWCDTANIIRAKAFHINELKSHTKKDIRLPAKTFALTALSENLVADTGVRLNGDVWLSPDWETLKLPIYADQHAIVMSHITHQAHPWPVYGRVFLENMIKALYQLYGVTLQVSFENVFYLLDENAPDMITSDDTLYASSEAIEIHNAFINDLSDHLFSQNIKVKEVYAGSGPGQLHVLGHHTDPLTAADQQLLFRETTRTVARQQGYIASFLPQIFPDAEASITPICLSLWENDLNVTGVNSPSRLSEITEYFMAGILYHLPALMAVTTPSVNSFKTNLSGSQMSKFAIWGHDNAEAAICVPSARTSSYPDYIQFKISDASANPYLALGCLIAAGLEGIKQKLPLDPEVKDDPAVLSTEEQAEKAIRPLHTNLWSALEDFRHNEMLKEAMGMELATIYLAVKQAEWTALESTSLEEEVKLLLEYY